MFARVVGLALAVVLILLAAPRLAAHLALAPGQRAAELILAGEQVAPSGYERAVTAHRAALEWIADGRLEIRLGMIEVMYADFLEDERAGPLMLEGTTRILAGLARHPVESHGWLLLARVFYEAGRPLDAAGALDWAYRTMPYDPDNTTPRVILASELWELLEPETREGAAHDLLAWFRRAPREVVAFAVMTDSQRFVAELLDLDWRARRRFAELLRELRLEAARRAREQGGNS